MTVFANAATPIDDRLVVLDDLRRAVIVEKGALDLFAVRPSTAGRADGGASCAASSEGALLIGAPRGPLHGMVGRPVPGTLATHLPIKELEALCGGDAAKQFVDGLEKGIVGLAQALRETLPPREFVPLSTGDATVIPNGKAARSVDGVLWVHVEDGVVEMAEGVAGQLTAGAEICVTERDWLVAQGEARVRASSTRALLDQGLLWGHLVTHAARVLYTIDRRVERRNAAERELLSERQQRDAGTLASAARGFDTVLRDTGARIRLADVAGDSPTLAAARLVASHLGFRVKAPVTGSGRNLDALQSIALASGVRTRTIRLDGPWWRHDLGPLVGYPRGTDAPWRCFPSATAT